jgi:hypothetical protein
MNLLDELIERDDPVFGSAAIEQLRAACVPRRQVAQRAAPLVLVLDALAALDHWRGGPGHPPSLASPAGAPRTLGAAL